MVSSHRLMEGRRLNQHLTGNQRSLTGSSQRLLSNRRLVVSVPRAANNYRFVSSPARPHTGKAIVGTLASNGSRSAWLREFGQPPTGRNCPGRDNN